MVGKEYVNREIRGKTTYTDAKTFIEGEKSLRKMYLQRRGLSVGLLLMILLMIGCGNGKSVISQEEERQAYFEIVEMINQKNYIGAEEKIIETYGNISFNTENFGFNKMNILRLCYLEQGKYDATMDVLMKYFEENGYLEKWDETKRDPQRLENAEYVIGQVKGVLDLVSEEKKAEVMEYFGDKILMEE